MSFPRIIYGRCPVCGGKGKNNSSPGSAFSTEDHTGTGYNLEYYRGRLMCQMCNKRLTADEESSVKSERYNEEQRFLKKSGVKENMAD